LWGGGYRKRACHPLQSVDDDCGLVVEAEDGYGRIDAQVSPLDI
jgi:hypothetical protein